MKLSKTFCSPNKQIPQQLDKTVQRGPKQGYEDDQAAEYPKEGCEGYEKVGESAL